MVYKGKLFFDSNTKTSITISLLSINNLINAQSNLGYGAVLLCASHKIQGDKDYLGTKSTGISHSWILYAHKMKPYNC